jgi:ribonuclease HI
MLILVFVDDIIVAFHAHDKDEWAEYHASIAKKYKVRDLGAADWLLQMKITRDRKNGSIILDQQRYIEKVLKQFNMTECKAVDVPAAKLVKTNDEQSSQEDPSSKRSNQLYMSLVGSLLYAAITTRLDIAYAVNVLSRHMLNPTDAHWQAGKRILRYLQGTRNLGLSFKKSSANEFQIEAYSDADWAGDQEDRKSTTGYVIRLNGSVVSWVSKKQATIALSSAEAEYMAISAAMQEIKWIEQLLTELNVKVTRTAQLFCDNQAAIAISQNDVHHARTKHIDIRHHYIREAIHKKEVNLSWIRSEDQLADIFTKALPRQVFQRLRIRLLVSNAQTQ